MLPPALRCLRAAARRLGRPGALRLRLPIALALAVLLAATAAPGPAAAGPAPGGPAATAASGDAAWLESRAAAWPDWSLPAPLPRPGRSDLRYPAWFAGSWRVVSHDLSGQGDDLSYTVRFEPDGRGAVVGDRAGNAAAVGRALLGEQLLAVRNDPRNPNRQLARLTGERQLESSVVGRRSSGSGTAAGEAGALFLADELALQVLHGPGDPRISRVETLSRYRHLAPGRIAAEQWQASYGSPAAGLVASGRHPWHGSLVLERLEPPSAPELPAVP